MSQNPGLTFAPLLPHKTTQKSDVLEVSQKKKHLDPRSFERGPPQGFKSNPWVPLFCSPCSYAEAFLPPPLQKVVLLNMVSLFGSKARMHVEILKNGSPLQQISPKMLKIGVILFVIWETTWDTKLVSSAAATHAASNCFYCSWPQGQPNRCKDQSPKSFQKIHVQKSMAAWRLPNHKQFLQLRFNMTLI